MSGDDEVTLRKERAAFERLCILPCVLRGVLELLREELELAMVLTGVPDLESVSADLLWKR